MFSLLARLRAANTPWAHWARVGGTLLLAWLAARLCLVLNTPIPWMLGPLLVTALVSLCGLPTASDNRFRNGGQWIIGCALGLYFTPQVGALVVSLWWAIALSIVWALALGLLFSHWLARMHARSLGLSAHTLRATTYFAGAIGGASEMTLLAERHGARTDLVAAAHSLRVAMVIVIVPFAVQGSGINGLDPTAPVAAAVWWPGLALLALANGVGAWVMKRSGRANPWFMGALLVTMALTMAGQQWSGLPKGLTDAAQLVIGISLGVRFRPAFLHMAPRWLGSVVLATVVMMGACAGFAWALSALTGLPLATLVLGTSPGGIAEMAITAKVLQLGVPLVTAFQACRLVAVLMLAEPVYRRWFRPEPTPG